MTANNNKNTNTNNSTSATNDKMTTKACSIKIHFQGASRNVELPSPATLTYLQEAIGSTFAVELPVRSAGIVADGDLSFTYRDSDGDDVVFDLDSELNLALHLCPELEVKATALDGDHTKDAQQHGGPEREQQQRAPEEVGDIYDVAARNLRENNGVPSMTAVSLRHTLALLQLRPRRLVVQGLAPWRLLRNVDMPLLPPKKTTQENEGVLAGDGAETPCETTASASNSNEKEGHSLEPKPESPNGKEGEAKDAPVAVDAAVNRSGVSAAAVDDAPVRSRRDGVDGPSDKEQGSEAHMGAAPLPTSVQENTAAAIGNDSAEDGDPTSIPAAVGSVDGTEEDNVQPRRGVEDTAGPSKENKPAAAAGAADAGGNNNIETIDGRPSSHEDPIHAALAGGGVHLNLGEVRPLLYSLGLDAHHFVKLGLVEHRALYGVRCRGERSHNDNAGGDPRRLVRIGGRVIGWGKWLLPGVGSTRPSTRPRDNRPASAPPTPAPRRGTKA